MSFAIYTYIYIYNIKNCEIFVILTYKDIMYLHKSMLIKTKFSLFYAQYIYIYIYIYVHVCVSVCITPLHVLHVAQNQFLFNLTGLNSEFSFS